MLDRHRILVSIHSLCCNISEYDVSVSASWPIPDMPFVQR